MTDISAWIGRTEEAHDQLSRNLLMRIAATFGETTPAHGEALPPLWQWCFFQEPVAESGLGEDGHPARGGFLPPADNRNRMWAGGRVEFLRPLEAGGEARRVSTIKHIEEKQGRTGALLFVTVQHDYLQDSRLAIREERHAQPARLLPRQSRRPPAPLRLPRPAPADRAAAVRGRRPHRRAGQGRTLGRRPQRPGAESRSGIRLNRRVDNGAALSTVEAACRTSEKPR